MTAILCTGDFQLGLGGRLDDQAVVLDRIATVAIERDVDLVLDAGDTFEGPGITPEELDVFASFVARLRSSAIPVLATLGNGRHDRAVREVNGLAIFDHIDGITVAPRPDVYRFGDVLVATLPWVHHGRRVAAHGGGDRDAINQEIAGMLLKIARNGSTDCDAIDPDAAHVLLAHWHVDQATAPNGGTASALFGEALLPLYELATLGYDAVVLGHNHRSQLLCAEPPVFHVGSPLAHDFGEAGFDHGVWILEGCSGALVPEFVPVKSRRLITLDIDPEAAGLAVGDVDDALVRVRYTATQAQARSIDHQAIRAALLAAGAAAVQFSPDIVRVDRARAAGVDETLGPLAALDMFIDAQQINGEDAVLMRDRTYHYLEGVR